MDGECDVGDIEAALGQGQGPRARQMVDNATQNGDWVLLPPLATGSHDLRVWGGLDTFRLDVTYHLVVL